MSNAKVKKIRVWDMPLRIFHWALLVCVVGAIASIEIGENIDVHQYFGYAVLSLLCFRLVWGFLGSEHARFKSFVRGPAQILSYLKNINKHSGPSIGHNPLGALSVLGMLTVLLIQGVSGLFLTDEIMFEGPLFKHISSELADTLAKIHDINAKFIFALIGLHIAAILFYRFIKRENLITPMITGNKEVAPETPASDAQGGNALLGFAVLASSAALIWLLVTQT